MKKYLLVNLTILFAVAFLWAEDATIVEPPAIDIEADATVSWGIDFGGGTYNKDKGKYDIDGVKHGFKNAASWKVKFPLIKKGNKTSKGEDPVYGQLTVKDIELTLMSEKGKNDDKFQPTTKVGGLDAKFVFYGAYIQVFDKPGFKSNYANLWDPFDTEDFKRDESPYKFEPGFDGAYGVKFGYADEDMMGLDVGLKFGSNGNWEAKEKDGEIDYDKPGKIKQLKPKTGEVLTVNEDKVWIDLTTGEEVFSVSSSTKMVMEYERKDRDKGYHSKYGIGLDFSMKPLDKMLGIKLSVGSTFDSARTGFTKDGKWAYGYDKGVSGKQVPGSVAFNIGTEITSEPIESLNLKLAFDGGSTFETGNKNKKGEVISAFAWDMLFDVKYMWVSSGLYVSSPGTGYAGNNGKTTNSDDVEIADMAMYVGFETAADPAKDTNLVEGLNAGVKLGMYRLISYGKRHSSSKWQLPMLMKIWADYTYHLDDVMWIKPYVVMEGETNHWEAADGTKIKDPYFGVGYRVGVTYSPVEKVEITADWNHGKINNNKYPFEGNMNGMVLARPANYKNHNGTFVLSVKVKY